MFVHTLKGSIIFTKTFPGSKPILKIRCPVRLPCLNYNTKKLRLVAGLRPDPLGELTALHRPPSWIKGEGREGGERGRKEREGPPMFEVR